jgi:hypothetical protein
MSIAAAMSGQHQTPERWHVERGVNVSLVVTIIIWGFAQTAMGAWFASAMDKRIESLEKMQPNTMLQGERLTRLEEKVVAVQTGIADIKVLLSAARPEDGNPNFRHTRPQ